MPYSSLIHSNAAKKYTYTRAHTQLKKIRLFWEINSRVSVAYSRNFGKNVDRVQLLPHQWNTKEILMVRPSVYVMVVLAVNIWTDGTREYSSSAYFRWKPTKLAGDVLTLHLWKKKRILVLFIHKRIIAIMLIDPEIKPIDYRLLKLVAKINLKTFILKTGPWLSYLG